MNNVLIYRPDRDSKGLRPVGNLAKFIFSLMFLFAAQSLWSQKNSIELANGLVSRTFYFSEQGPGFHTSGYRNLVTGADYSLPGSEEFCIRVNDVDLTGNNCTYVSHDLNTAGDQTTLSVVLRTPVTHIQIILRYIVYDRIPLVRKRLQVINTGSSDAVLCDLDVERLQFNVVSTYMNEVYANYGTHLTRVPYKGDYNDAAVLLFNLSARQGAIFGNEAPSVLKRLEIYSRPNQVAIGMGLIGDPFPFKNDLRPGETFTSPQTFIYFSSSPKWQYAFEGSFQTFIREKLGVKLFEQQRPPYFIYNSWQPFYDNIDETLIKQCADSLQHTACDLFIIDAGWYRRAGDFTPDPKKFPNGLKPVVDYIHSKGMRAGLWFSIGTVHNKSKVALEHPEWLIRDINGRAENLQDGNLEEDGDGWTSAKRTMSLGSGYYDHILKILRSYVRTLGLSYLKLDLGIANSAYLHDSTRTGDYDTAGGKGYKDRSSSYWVIYERMLSLMDTLKTEFPDLLIDCTFEVWGRYNLVDYALIEHADYDWLTNFDFPPPEGPISIRQMNFDRSRAVPASTLLIGNQFMDFPNYKYVYFSMAGGANLMVGDPRNLTADAKLFYFRWNSWFKKMDEKYQFTRFRQTYDIFDKPTDENWDGCFRFNSDKNGGVLFFYRNNSGDSARIFKIPCLNADVLYNVYEPLSGRTIGSYKGISLQQNGLRITIPATYSAAVFGIEKAFP